MKNFLGLSQEESAYIEIRLALAEALVSQRKKLHYTQAQVAKRIKSTNLWSKPVRRIEPAPRAPPTATEAAF